MSPPPIRCRETWKTRQKSLEPDSWLDEMGFYRKHIARDSSCLFRAVSENIYNTQKYFHKVRLDCVEFMASKRDLFEGSLNCPFEDYLKELANPSTCGGLVEISAMSHLYRHDFVIFEGNKRPQTKICNGYGDTVLLFYSVETKHFDVVYTKEYINSSSFCQSLVYEILYDGVYQMKDLQYAVDKMLHDKIPSNNGKNQHMEYTMSQNVDRRKKQKERAKIYFEPPNDEEDSTTLSLKCKHHTQDIEHASLLKESLSIFVFQRNLIQLSSCMNCLNVNSAKDLLDNGITPFPYKVAKVLDPDIYRNVEFDVWSEMRREIRCGARYSDGTTLQVGVRCLVKDPDQATYHCHIQEMRPDGGPCLVFIEELGEKRVVEFGQLETLPLNEVRPWAPPYRHSKANFQYLMLSQMFQQIGNITRKQGFNKRKAKSSEDVKLHEKSSIPPLWKDGKDAEMTLTPVDGQHDVEGMSLLHQGGQVNQNHENIILQKWKTQHRLDLYNFELPAPAEVACVPQVVDCRGTTSVLDMNPTTNDNMRASGDMGESRAPNTPSALLPPATLHTYVPPMNNGSVSDAASMPPPPPPGAYMAHYAPYSKPMLWIPQPAPTAPVGLHVFKSVQPNGSDLPMGDIPTLRYFFNLGVDCMMQSWRPQPLPSSLQPKPYSPRELTNEMQQMSLNSNEFRYKDNTKPSVRRPAFVGPRFTRTQDQNQGNRGAYNRYPLERRDSYPEHRAYEPPTEPMPAVQYMYTPPMYPVYYPVEDPAILGMGYVENEERAEYNTRVQPYYQTNSPPPATTAAQALSAASSPLLSPTKTSPAAPEFM